MQPRGGAAFYVCFIASKILQVSDNHITPSNKIWFTMIDSLYKMRINSQK